MDVLAYIRNFFGTLGRKRRACDDYDSPINKKFRRISCSQMSSAEDDWISSVSSNSIRRRSGFLDKRDVKYRTSFLKENAPINIDDDEDVIEVKKPVDSSFEFLNKSVRLTSTPNGNRITLNGDGDVTFVKSINSSAEKKGNAKKRGFDYIKPISNVNPLQNGTSQSPNRLLNGTRRRETAGYPIFSSLRDITFPQSRKMINTHSSALDESYRLDEKRKYQELLNKAAPSSSSKNLLDSFAGYSGKLWTSSNISRGKKLIDLARNIKKPIEFIDLTENKKSNGERLSTRATIQKVLKKYDNDVVIIKDSDSEVEVLPVPPSPKPDFPVEKCNSLKIYVDRSEPQHDKWMGDTIKKHDQEILRRQKLIALQVPIVEKYSGINDTLRSKLLEENIRKCLHIKEVLLPDEEPSVALPALTSEQEALIDNALDKSQSSSEVLVGKFGINISRRDMLTLAGLNWLNDEVINFYMNLIIERGKSDKWLNAYAFNTFFYPKISSSGQSSVRRWTRRVDIFSYDIIAVPIHLGMHWCMAIIDFRKKCIGYYDSMGSSNRSCLESLLKYLQDEHLDKKKSEFDVSDWRLINVKDIPQQMNGSDCGMFSCTFAEFLTRDAEITFSQDDMPYLRRKMVLELLQSSLLIS